MLSTGKWHSIRVLFGYLKRGVVGKPQMQKISGICPLKAKRFKAQQKVNFHEKIALTGESTTLL